MADAAVEFLLGNLKQLLVYNADLIHGVKEQVESLCSELRMLAAFVKDATEKRNEYAVVEELVKRIRVVVYEAEDVIETYVVYTAVQKARSSIERLFHIIDYPAELRSVGKKIELVRRKVKEIYDNKLFGFEALNTGAPYKKGLSKRKQPVVEEDNVVGFDNDAKMLVERLTGEAAGLEVISVVGMGGLGKTTLARKVFNDPSIQYKFFIRAWIYVSQEYTRREIFLGILSCITQITDDMRKTEDERLAFELRRHLEGGRYLIVMDDVWTREAWDDLKMAFPNNNNQSRILLTSRHREVAVLANPIGEPHQLRFLTDVESWELLQWKVFRRLGSCPSDLVVPGKQMAQKCHGLPLAIVVIAGILVKKEKTCKSWTKVADSVSSYIAMNPEQCMDILALSYNHLPYHLKACFIYFGVFPEDFEIPVWKLIRLWVAEGFVQQIGDVSLEDMAEENLEELVDRNLVLVETRRSNGGIKTCRIHDMLHDLCRKTAEEENFFQEIKSVYQIHSSFTDNSNIFRRFCIHSRVLEFISSKPCGPHVRSFLCFALEESVLPLEHVSFIPAVFKLLRVLDIRPVNFIRFPSEIVQLVHLRYIALLGEFRVLPATISNLWNVQTLIVETTSRTFEIQADIWRMVHLRHLYTCGSSKLPNPSSKSQKGGRDPLVKGNLQTISTISPESCAENILARTPNLRKLGIRGNLIKLVEEKGGSSRFDNLAKLDRLETLKLLNDTFPRPPMESKLPGLPQWYKFPPKLKKLTLSDTLLEWKHIAVLAMLPGLEVLKLKDNAFRGESWGSLDRSFSQLRVLQLGRTDLVHWEASNQQFPVLQRVIFKHCESLVAIPSGLGDIPALQIMELYWPTTTAAASARRIQNQQQTAVNKALKLIIYPPEQ